MIYFSVGKIPHVLPILSLHRTLQIERAAGPGGSPREHARARGGGLEGDAERGLAKVSRPHHQREDERQGKKK